MALEFICEHQLSSHSKLYIFVTNCCTSPISHIV